MKEEYSWTEKGTLFSNVYDDVFFQDGDGLEESNYVFLQGNNIAQRLAKQDLIIGELGFGTGLNFLLTWQQWLESGKKNGKRLTFVSCEKHPLNQEVLQKAHSQFPQLKEFSTELRKKWPPVQTGFHLLEFEEGKVALLLLFGDCYESLKKFEGKVDAWYLDGFAPAKNEAMWSENVFRQMAWHSHEKTTLATFTAAGFVRRGLEGCGFKIDRIKGYKYKRHMTVGEYCGHVKERLHLAPWYRSPDKLKSDKIAVIGAGMAGLNLAYYLERAGYQVSVFEAEDEIASKASGNKRGMMYPLISKKPDRLGSLTEAGHHFSYSQMKELGIEYREGILEFISSDKKAARFDEAIQRYSKDYIELVETAYGKKALNHKKALSIAPKEYASVLQSSLKNAILLDEKLLSLHREKDNWLLSFESGRKEEFEAVFLANSYDVKKISQASHLPLRVSRGQVAYLESKDVNLQEKDLNFINYLTKAEDCYVLGATFDVDDTEEAMRVEDTEALLSSLKEHFPDSIDEVIPRDLKGRVSFRAVVKDYFPIVGAVPDLTYYQNTYADLKHGRPISSYPDAMYCDKLFSSCSHGSRGLSFSALSAAYLARLLKDGIHILNTSHVEALHPSRFLIKDYKKT